MPRQRAVSIPGVGRVERRGRLWILACESGREESHPYRYLAVEALRVAQARSEAARALGSRGGRVTGPSKARASAGDVSRAYWASLTPEQRREQGQIRAESRRRKKAEAEREE
jgi:hypothetical protein